MLKELYLQYKQRMIQLNTLVPAEEQLYYPITPPQNRLMILNELMGSITAYNMYAAFTLEGEIDIHQLQKSISALMVRHESLRTSFHWINGEPLQQIHEKCEFNIENIQALDEDVDEIISNFIRPFDLEKAPLFRVGLVHLSDGKQVFLFDMHHIITDGISMGIVLEELKKLYAGEKLTPLNLQFKDYSVWLNKNKKMLEKQEEYWQDIFPIREEVPQLRLPTDFPKPNLKSFHGSEVYFSIAHPTMQKLINFSNQFKVTVHTIIKAAFVTLLSKYSQQEDVVVGSVNAGRGHPLLENVVGMFVNTLAIRSFPSRNKTFKTLVSEVQKKILEAYNNQDYPIEALFDKVNKNGTSPSIDVMFVYEDRTKEFDGETFMFLPYEIEHRTAKFDLTLFAQYNDDCIDLSFEYCTELFHEKTIQMMAENFLILLERLLHEPDKRIGHVEILSETEKGVLSEFMEGNKRFDVNQTVIELFEEQVEKTPHKVVVSFEDQSLTYTELNKKANQLARYLLLRDGDSKNTRIGIIADPSIEMLIGILGVLKSGKSYLPIDIDYPEKRINYILSDSGIELLLTNRENINVSFSGQTINLNDKEQSSLPTTNVGINVGTEDLAYIMYTSGSTGYPKGTMITHRGLTNYICWAKEYYLNHEDNHTFALYSSLAFDLTVTSIFTPLVSGNRIVVYKADESENVLEKIFRDQQATIIKLTPAHLSLIKDYDNTDSSVKKLIVGGENLRTVLVEKIHTSFNGQITIYNEYGPTETVVGCTVHIYDQENDRSQSVPIGKPIANTRIYILDKQLKLLPIGVPGELCIAGEGVARGYLNKPELTEEKFIASPFESDERLYRTGDLARWLPNGEIEILGRMDHQVKIRGYRIELGEIEHQILQFQDITGVVVCEKQDLQKQSYLCAYITIAPSREQEFTSTEIRNHLSRYLPSYMIPSRIIPLDKMPLTQNGKLDLKALPEPEGQLKGETEYQPPQSEIEERMYQIWKDILGINEFGINDNFFGLGGHSLKATQLISEVMKEFHVEIQLRQIFTCPTIKELACLVQKMEKKEDVYIPLAGERESYPLSSAQKRLFILDGFEGIETSYNIPFVLKIKGALNKAKFEKTITRLTERHESLRTSFHWHDGEAVQRIHTDITEPPIKYIHASEGESPEVIESFIRPFELNKAPLFRVGLLTLSNDEYLLIFDIHHIIFDGLSINIIVDEFSRLYKGEGLAPLEIQYKDFAIWFNDRIHSVEMKRQKEYWENLFLGDIPTLNLPTDYPRPQWQSFDGKNIEFSLDKNTTAKVNKLAIESQSTVYTVLLSAFALLLSKYSNQEDVVVGTVSSGRSNPSLERVIGMFANTLPIRCHPKMDLSFVEYLKEVNNNVIQAQENQDYPFENLLEKINVHTSLDRNPLFDSFFILQNYEAEEIEIDGLVIKDYDIQDNYVKFDLTMAAVEDNGEIRFTLQYRKKLFAEKTVERMVRHYQDIMECIVENRHILLKEIEFTSNLLTLENVIDDVAEFNF